MQILSSEDRPALKLGYPAITQRVAALMAFFCAGLMSASPLIIYDDPNLAGTGQVISNTYTVYSGSGIPGSMNDKTSSFELDKGYMAVFADNLDGTGVSKVYVADSAPLTVNSLPAGLDNSISFIRVIQWKDTTKKGICSVQSDTGVNDTWYYTWGKNVNAGKLVQPREYVPMSWGHTTTDSAAINDYRAMDQVGHLLSFNESDDCNGQSGQWGNLCDIPTAVGYHKELMKAGLRLGSPGGRENAANNASSWTPTFLQQCDALDIRNDFVALHWYDWGNYTSTNDQTPTGIFNRFKKYLSNAYHNCGERPLWITEFNANDNRARSVHDGFLQLALPYLESLGYVERYSFFQTDSHSGSFFEPNGNLTSTGQIYHDQVSTPAYTPKGVSAPWQNQDVGLVGAAGSAIYAAHNGTFTVCGSGNDIGGTADEFHYVYQPMSGDGEIIARVSSMIWRHNWTKSGVMIRESLDAGSRHASMFISSSSGAAFQSRSATGGTTTGPTQAGIEAPYWVKLQRQGNILTGFISPDGSSWTQVGSKTISMGTAVYAGLAVTARNDGTFNDAVITDVSFIDENTDSDFDELSDLWEIANFVTIATSGGGSDNQDGDSDSDLHEFLAGTDPSDPSDFFQTTISEANGGTLGITFSAISRRVYVLETNTTLSADGWTESDSVSPTTDGIQQLLYTHPENPPKLFGRIVISRP